MNSPAQAISHNRRPGKLAASKAPNRRVGHYVSSFEVLELRCLLSASSASASRSHTNVVLFSSSGLKPLASSGPVGLTPTQIRDAYGFNQISFNGGIVGDGTGETIAIIDAYHDPTIQTDLAAFDTAFGLPAPPTFTQVAQNGTTNYPTTDPSGKQGAGDDTWELETALDVEWSHALAPGANILLVEATSTSDANLIQAAVNYARSQPGVVAVSMSFSGSEFSSESSYDTYFTTPSGHAGVTFLAATGDDGEPSGYPAYSPDVLAVGGTTLSTDSAGDYLGESGWSGSGGGVSAYESQPSYQSGIVTQSSTKRANPDVAFDADPNSGVGVYDSYDFGTTTPWIQVGGTSFATPSWAALIAIADQGRSLAGLSSLDGSTQTLPLLYQLPSTDFHDITSGNNGFAAAAGYDLVTGLGSPKANLVVAGLLGSSISGTVYNDANSNGVQNSGETGMSGVTVFDDVDDNGVFDPAVQATYASTNVPVTIPDVTTITSTEKISGIVGAIDDLNVEVNITHTYDSDLVITLISPTGTQIVLASHDGRNGHNYTNTIFDDQASSSISSGRAPFTGSYRPIGTLSTLNGTDANGVWTLQVADTVAQDSGTLNSWSLQITTGADFSVTTDANGNYKFTNVSPGEHYIREITPSNFTETAPSSGVYAVNVVAGASITGVSFGNVSNQAVVIPPVLGDFNQDKQLDAADIAAGMMALTDLPDYLTKYSVTAALLATYDDVNHDGYFTSADLQYILQILKGGGGNSSPTVTQSTSTLVTSSSAAAPVVSSSAITNEGYTNPRPISTVAIAGGGTSGSNSLPTNRELMDDLLDKMVSDRILRARIGAHFSSLAALEEFFAHWS
ncbi:MAG TPA: proprotein convertase P-domain-containing protein [Pirellulales bacterium]|nr:proprotein convertase P-domain-containing protein [Pirellulales bacterium]